MLELTESVTLNPEAQRAISALDLILEKYPNNVPALLEKAFILFRNQADGKAIELLNSIIAHDSSCIDAYVWLAELYVYHWADAEEAQKIVEQALSTGLLRADLYFLLACAYEKQADAANRLKYVQKSVAMEPTWIAPRLNLIGMLIDQHDIANAQEQLTALKHHLISTVAPKNEMQKYYETFITGRIVTDYTKKLLQEYEDKVNYSWNK